MSLYFNATYLHNTLLLISGTNDGSKFPEIKQDFEHFTSNDKAAYFSSGKLADSDEPVRVLLGDLPPNKTEVIGRAHLQTDNKRLYVGDVRLESFLIVQLPEKNVDIVVSADFSGKQPTVYVQIKSTDLRLIKKQSLFSLNENLQGDIDKIGTKDGCHICGNKKEQHYIPHLLPPLEVALAGEKKWYPICRKDFNKYEQEVSKILKNMI